MSTEKIPDVPRTIRHLDTDEQWAKRDTTSKLHATAAEAAWRLGGLSSVLFGLGIYDDSRRRELSFLGSAVKDIALALERVTEAQMAEWNAETDKPAKRLPAPARKARRAAA